MRKSIRTIAIVLVLVTLFAQFTTVASAWVASPDDVLGIVNKHSPSGTMVLNKTFERAKGKEVGGAIEVMGEGRTYFSQTINKIDELVTMWVPDWAKNNAFLMVSTAVHESYHYFQTDGYLYIQPYAITERRQLVNGNIVEYHILNNSIVPTDTVTGNYTGTLANIVWKTYVSKDARTIANNLGVYGLLDEFSGYYYGILAAHETVGYLFELIEKHGISLNSDNYKAKQALADYLDDIDFSLYKSYQFLYWIMEYMEYLRVNRPSDYTTVLNNTNFITALAWFIQKFDTLATHEIPATRTRIENTIEQYGLWLEERQIDYRIHSSTNAYSIDKKALIPAIMETLRSNKYQQVLANLGIQATTALASPPPTTPVPVTPPIAAVPPSTIANKSQSTIVMRIGSPTITINGVQSTLDPMAKGTPMLVNGSTLVPMRPIFDLFGYSVNWYSGRIIAKNNNNSIVLTVGSNIAYRNSAESRLQTAPQNINGRTMVPLKFIAESLGADVEYQPNTKTIIIRGVF